MLHQVVQPRIFLEQMLGVGGQGALDGREVQRGDNLAVKTAVDGHDGTTDGCDVTGRVIVDEESQPRVELAADAFDVPLGGDTHGRLWR